MPGHSLTHRPFIQKLGQNLRPSIATIRSDREEVIGQKARGAFPVDKPASAKRGLGIRDMLVHHLPKREIGTKVPILLTKPGGVTSPSP
jgi:hypothetical protein